MSAQQGGTGPAMDLHWFDRQIEISDSVLQSELVIRRYDSLAADLLADFQGHYTAIVKSRETAVEALTEYAAEKVSAGAEILADLCVSHGIFEYNQETLFQRYS